MCWPGAGAWSQSETQPPVRRNFEYFSEDPYLAGKLAAGSIRGIEGEGVGASLKHFAANSQEKCRFNSDSIMDERTLRELYLTAFEIAVKEGKPSTVMCAYPKLNGIHCSDNKKLLTDILRTEWGFEGAVITDWGAMNDRIEGFRAGCDLNMPGGSGYMEKDVLRAVRSGALPESAVNASARRVLKLVFRPAATLKERTGYDEDAHHDLARQAAEAGAVLLKNDGQLLPLRSDAKIAVIGYMAEQLRYQGAGSSHINPTRISQPLKYLPDAVYAAGYDAQGDTTEAMLAEAVRAAKEADTAVAFAGLPDRYEYEGFDRENMKMPAGHLQMIEAVANTNPRTVVVLLCGCAVECPWADQVKAVLYMGLPGQAGGEAIADLLYGRANPGGRLAESWPARYEDCPSASCYGKTKDALYLEGVYVGYRYYDKAQKAVRWPFGYGLSYTTFRYSDLRVEGRTVRVTVTNTGTIAGAEVVQLYVCPPQDGIHRPVRELKGFQKIILQPGEKQIVSIQLGNRPFALWNNGWVIPSGRYGIEIGGLKSEIWIDGEAQPVPAWQSGNWYETCTGSPTQAGWEAVLGRSYVPTPLKKGRFTMDNTVEEMKDYSLVMKIMYRAVEGTVAKGFGGKKDYSNPEFRMLMASSAGSPLRSMQISGGMKDGLMQGMLEIANERFLKGISKMIRG